MIYEFFRMIGEITGYPFQWLLFKTKIYFEGEKRKGYYKGGKLIISNHFSPLDYVLTAGIVFPRKLNPIASEDAFNKKFFKFGIRFFGGIQANRITKNMRFMDQAASVIKEKEQLVIIYPEGRDTPDGKIHEFKKSYIVIAHRAGCPILPMITDGNYGIFKRTSVMIGEDIDVSQFIKSESRTPTREELAAANEYIYNKMLWLREELERRKLEDKRGKK